uniref:S-adenosyl-L-methionine-dependent tRNA 4-demethylwyosine synthase TYW1 n=1 Tax=Ciona savignyi TaxID=51511 RepID=H2YWM3_CIOSA
SIVHILFGSQTGTAASYAHAIQEELNGKGIKSKLEDLKNFDPEDNFLYWNESKMNGPVLFLISTYTDGTPPPSCEWFCRWLQDASNDFRVNKSLLSNMRFAIFGLGNSLYSDHYNTIGRNLDRWLHKLSATRIFPFTAGDENVVQSKHGSIKLDFNAWKSEIISVLEYLLAGNQKNGVVTPVAEIDSVSSTTQCLVCTIHNPHQQEEEEEEEEKGEEGEDVVDVEDVGDAMSHYPLLTKLVYLFLICFVDWQGLPQQIKCMRKRNSKKPPEMITDELRKSLSKQGYRLIGSHSGVKLCRWTKSMLRGRGGCYKHTFYGIESHRCMETTPSLACANKCVFCWRHHSNPVGTEWKWKMDPAVDVIKGAIENHYDMIKQFKGVPGVKADRFAEGFSIKHCALSLVGEPIMYPEINDFIQMLHEKGISSFLVTNAQFPEAITTLLPTTQLYVSVDAATQDSLKKIDRPLFKDFWPRLIESLKALSLKVNIYYHLVPQGQRTVYRLTLVKAWNVDELEAYADLVALGKPDFIEVKGVTFCGDSKSSDGLTLKNVPWHDEVLHFVSQLTDMLDGYEIACEHEHSNCVLVAQTKFKSANGEWRTWIDYARFHELFQRFRATGESFTALDYTATTPAWAVLGADERGFDPQETRWRRKEKVTQGC